MYLAGLGVSSLQFLHFEHDLATWGSLLACSDPYLNTSNIIIIYPQEKGKIIKRVQGTNKIKLNTKIYSSFISGRGVLALSFGVSLGIHIFSNMRLVLGFFRRPTSFGVHFT